jgi:Zn-dependent protease with chaperone function
VFYYGLTVFIVVALIHGLSYGLLGVVDLRSHLFLMWTILSIIGVGTLIRMHQLKGGGKAIAEMLGGKLISPNTTKPRERRLLNLVEEMALASGIPVPSVYLLEDEISINAFAAGLTPQEAVIGVTDGALKKLNREELQGVIAHEFSHIFNGDMRLNLRLVSVLSGIMAIYNLGAILVRSFRLSGGSRNNRGGGQIILLGLLMMAIGSIGAIAARILKAAISRQREFLADATAVQYTRNPEGIGKALLKLRDQSAYLMRSSHAEEVSHMFFGSAIHFGRILATHPPLPERVKRIHPRLLEEYPPGSLQMPTLPPDEEESPIEGNKQAPQKSVLLNQALLSAAVYDLEKQWISVAGNPSGESLAQAKNYLENLPANLREASKSWEGVRAILISLFYASEPNQLEQQREIVRARLGEAALFYSTHLIPHVRKLLPGERLPIIELSAPAIRDTPVSEQKKLIQTLHALAKADGQIHFLEFSLLCLIETLWGFHQNKKSPFTVAYLNTLMGKRASSVLVSALLISSNPNSAAQEFELTQKAASKKNLEVQFIESIKAEDLEKSLLTLKDLVPAEKQKLFEVCIFAAQSDGAIQPEQKELLQVIGCVLSIPLPIDLK